MSRQRTAEKIVRPILEHNPEARNDDMVLYLMVCRDCMQLKKHTSCISLDEVMLEYRTMGIPCFETVRRVRQKIQASNPALGCCPAVRRARHKTQKEYRAYALNKDKGGETCGKG